jgi:hypothetical protein
MGEESMLKLLESVMPQAARSSPTPSPLRSVRPSVLDLRFTGDPWIVDHQDGTASVRLDNYRLVRIQTVPFDVPCLNHLLLELRQSQMRRRLFRQFRARGR